MVRFLEVIFHEVVRSGSLSNLGHINVLCGKNNSGKTTILEAISKSEQCAVGRKVDDLEYFVEVFTTGQGRTAVDPAHLRMWLRRYLAEHIEASTIWYSHQTEEIVSSMVESAQRDFNLRSYDITGLLRGGVNRIVQKAVSTFLPKLVPPKRVLEATTAVAFSSPVVPNGGGVVNRLFYLKNQSAETDDRRAFEEIASVFRKITSSEFQIVPDKNNNITLTFRVSGRWIPADQCGLGLSDVLVIVHQIVDGPETFMLIEEPENHLHAEFQRNLLAFMKSKKSKQFLISTHSSLFLDTETADCVFYVSSEVDGIHVSDQTSKSEIIRALGFSVSENLVSDAIVLTEGPTDIPVIRHILSWLGVDDTFNVRYWPIGGDIMSEVDLSVFAESRKVFAIIDNDPGSSVPRTRFVAKCRVAQIPCCRLIRYSLESYFSIEALRFVIKGEVPENLMELDPKESLDVQLGLKKKNKSVKSRNSQIIRAMTLKDLQGTDLLRFCQQIQKYLAGKKGPVTF